MADSLVVKRGERLTVTGRFNNVVSRRLPRLATWYGRLHATVYRRSRGRAMRRFNGRPAFRLEVRGRKTGEPRSVMLMLVRRGDELLVSGSNAGNPVTPQWYRNLVAAGSATVQVRGETYPVSARVVTDPEERAECWQLLTATYPHFVTYQALTDRELPIAVLTRSSSTGHR